MFERIDLHTHSNCSDGVLEPAALVSLAASRGVQLLALTDHDTTAGCDAARAACELAGMRFLDAVELTCDWRGRELHVVGLRVDPHCRVLRAHLEDVVGRRRDRIREIGRRLARHGIDGDALAGQALAASAAPTRTHLARLLVAQQQAATLQQAFDRWLARGQPGHAPANWPAMAATVQCVVEAGGLPVLAHPHRYRLSNGALRELCAEFRAAGGQGIEVSLAGMGPADADRAAGLARRFDLAGSIGSDFHEPGLPWRPLGRFAKLPDQVTPIIQRLGLAP